MQNLLQKVHVSRPLVLLYSILLQLFLDLVFLPGVLHFSLPPWSFYQWLQKNRCVFFLFLSAHNLFHSVDEWMRVHAVICDSSRDVKRLPVGRKHNHTDRLCFFWWNFSCTDTELRELHSFDRLADTTGLHTTIHPFAPSGPGRGSH